MTIYDVLDDEGMKKREARSQEFFVLVCFVICRIATKEFMGHGDH